MVSRQEIRSQMNSGSRQYSAKMCQADLDRLTDGRYYLDGYTKKYVIIDKLSKNTIVSQATSRLSLFELTVAALDLFVNASDPDPDPDPEISSDNAPVLIGDCDSATGYDKSLSPEDVTAMVELIMAQFPNKPALKINCVDRWHAKRRATAFYTLATDTFVRINFYQGGMNEGTVLHELAHIVPESRHGHGYFFKQQQTDLIRFWNTGSW